MKNLFNQVKLTRPKSNVFDLTHDVKMSGSMGNLIPSLVMECVPGDRIKLGADSLIRFAPLIAPVMHRMDVYVHYFFVPNRILWEGWEDFITGNSDAEAHPRLAITSLNVTAAEKKFLDYMGIPPISTGGITSNSGQINALPFAAYQAIYNEYYRDQNLIDEVDYKLVAGVNPQDNLLVMRQRAWEHDYFTSSLPFAQKGTQVDIPLGQIDRNVPVQATNFNGGLGAGPYHAEGTNDNSDPVVFNIGENTTENTPDGDLMAETKGLEIEPTTINDLRLAFRLQEWFEKNARAGTRYFESILAHFGVRSPDARLQRPEYITGVKSPVIISEVLNTTGESAGLPQGNMAGHGVSVTTGKMGSYYCQEHGYIIGILSVMPKTAYMQGIPRHYNKTDRYDYFWPTFAHLGEQEVKQKEIMAWTSNQEDTFGYVPRYAEYKFMPSRVAGEFRSSLDYWHLGRKFATNPTLSQEFIECTPSQTSRIFAVEENVDHLYMHVLHKIKAIRPMPQFGTPTI